MAFVSAAGRYVRQAADGRSAAIHAAVVTTDRRTTTANRLLAALPPDEAVRLQAVFESVNLDFGALVGESGKSIDHVYFPTTSFISLIMPADADAVLEVGLVGNEGMVGLPLALGIGMSSLRAVVQGAGHAWRMDAATFTRELEHSAALRRVIALYTGVQMAQLAQTAACTRFHLIEARLARWLLMTQDRAHAGRFLVTQEFLAMMLGVRRVGVTKAAGALQKRGLIRYTRGDLAVIDRRALKAASCSCYAADARWYTQILG